MYALSVRQPWASEIAVGLKTVEHRPWSWSYRGPLVICATQKPVVRLAGELLPVGVALAVVELVDVVREPGGMYGFVLERPRLIVPVPVLGQLKPWRWRGPEPVEIDEPDAALLRERLRAASLAEGASITAKAKAEAAAARGAMTAESERRGRGEALRAKYARKKGPRRRP